MDAKFEWCKVRGCLGFRGTDGFWYKHNSIAHDKEIKRIKRHNYYLYRKYKKIKKWYEFWK